MSGGASRPAPGALGTDRRDASFAMLVLAVALVLYVRTFANGFVLDDEGIIVHNGLVHHASGIWRAFVTPYWPNGAGQYRPLVIASFSAEWSLWRGHAAGFHAVNVLWHGGASVLLYFLARRWMLPTASLIAALLFAVHPVHTEAVANVVGRAELMAACGVIGTLLLHQRRSPWAIVTFAGALLCKEHALVTPMLAAAIDLCPAARADAPAKKVLPLYAGYALVACAWAAVVFVLFHNRLFAAVDPFWESMGAPARWLTVLGIVPVWIRLWLFPADLTADYSPQVTQAWPANIVLMSIGTLIVALLLLAAWTARRREPLVVLALAGIAICMAPVANLLVPTGVIVAERTLYLSSAGVVLLAGAAGAWLLRRRPAATTVAIVLLVAAGGVRTWTREAVWKSDRSLFLATAAANPLGSWTHVALARIYEGNRGFGDAAHEYRSALTLFDRRPDIWAAAIEAANKANELTLADSFAVAASHLYPGDYNVSIAHASVLLQEGRTPEALTVVRNALLAAPDSAAGHLLAGLAWQRLGMADSARAELRHIGAADPLRARADSISALLPPSR